MAEATRNLSSGVALLLSFLGLGVGQLYNGEHLKAIAFVVVYMFVIRLAFHHLSTTFGGLMLVGGLIAIGCIIIHADAFMSARRLRIAARQSYNRWFVYLLAILLIPLGTNLAVRAGAPIRAYRTPSPAMEPTLQRGDFFLATDRTPQEGNLERGDIIVFRNPGNTAEDYVKRLVGLAGDTVEVRDKAVFLNGDPLDEPYVKHIDPRTIRNRDNFGPYVVHPGTVFVLGDNRDNSADSRLFGGVDLFLIRGRALYIYFSLDSGNTPEGATARVRTERIGRRIASRD